MKYIAKNFDKEVRFYEDELEKAVTYWGVQEPCESLEDLADAWNSLHSGDAEGELRVYGESADTFRIKPEFYDSWAVTDGEDIVDRKEIERLAYEWGTTVDHLMEQVKEV